MAVGRISKGFRLLSVDATLQSFLLQNRDKIASPRVLHISLNLPLRLGMDANQQHKSQIFANAHSYSK
jgi:hypothetical protein